MGKNRFAGLVALAVIICTLLTLSLSPVIQAKSLHSQLDSSPPVDVLINFKQLPGPAQVDLVTAYGGQVKEVYNIAPTIAASIPSGSIDLLRREPTVKSIEEDLAIPNILCSQVLPWGVDRVDADLVQAGGNKGTGVKVAVLDTGIDLDHPDLSVAGNVTFVYGTSTGDDDNGHGTKVAGIIGALDNDIGVVGVAPEAALYAVKVLNSNGDGIMSNILSGIQWAVDNNMKVINMSFGSSMGMGDGVEQALSNAYSLGIVLVAGAGNGGNAEGTGNNIWAPARYTPVIAVGCLNNTDTRDPVSSTGYQLEVMAPGVDIYSTAMGGDYGYLTTTSAAAPHAAGVAALMIHAGITSNTGIRNQLASSATDLGATGWDPQYGFGLINAVSAINFSEPPDQTPPVTSIACSGTLGNYGWYVSDVTVTLSATDGGSGVAQTKYSLDGGTTWNVYSSPFTLTTDGSNLVLARSWDNAGNDEMPAFATIKIDKTPPVVSITVDPTTLPRIGKRGTMAGIYYSTTSQDAASGVDAVYISLTDEYGVYNNPNLGGVSGTTYVEQWCEGGDSNGRVYTFRATAYDGAGNSAYSEATCVVIK